MAAKTIRYEHRVDGVLTNATGVVLRDPANLYGARRTDTLGILVAAGVALTLISTGIYEITLPDVGVGVSIDYWIERTYNGQTKRTLQTLQATAGSVPGGIVALPPSAYAEMGVQTVSCGDAGLEEFLNTWAPTIWAMQARQGVALDLRYQYFVRDLISPLALDYVRTMVDTETANQQSQETSYSNSSSLQSSSASSERTRTASATQSASSSQSFTRSSSRTASSQMGASASTTSSRTGSSTDDSIQTNTSKTTRTSSQHLETTNTPYVGVGGTVAGSSDYKLLDSVTKNNMEMREDVRRFSTAVAFLGTFSGQTGYLDENLGVAKSKETVDNGVGNLSTIDYSSQDSGISAANSGYVLSGKGKNSAGALTGGGGGTVTTDMTTIGTGSRTNNVHRTSHSEMSGLSTQTSSGTMSSTSHDEQHRAAESLAHSESAGSASSTTSGSGHSESQGASSMQGSSSLNRQYYSQIFDSLEKMHQDCIEQIAQLEGQMLMTTRTIIQKLSVRTPQAGLVVSAASRTNAVLGPAGLRFIDGRLR